MKNKGFVFTFICVVTGIGVLSLIPPESGVELGDHDKWNHFIAYSILALNWTFLKTNQKVFWLGLGACFLYGLILEFLQGFVPGRESSIMDALANLGGVMSGFVLYYLMKRFE
ncbi:VanZ family protein [Crocinitomicaceae bacterium]|nr:VanZ family protein [Crocinitomicaceae bacterium]